jgi:hypothetical protein
VEGRQETKNTAENAMGRSQWPQNQTQTNPRCGVLCTIHNWGKEQGHEEDEPPKPSNPQNRCNVSEGKKAHPHVRTAAVLSLWAPNLWLLFWANGLARPGTMCRPISRTIQTQHRMRRDREMKPCEPCAVHHHPSPRINGAIVHPSSCLPVTTILCRPLSLVHPDSSCLVGHILATELDKGTVGSWMPPCCYRLPKAQR